MRHILLLPLLTLALVACPKQDAGQATPQPQQPPVVEAPPITPAPAPSLPACEIVTVQRLPTSVLVKPVDDTTRPTIRAVLGDGSYAPALGEQGLAIPFQGYNLAAPDAVIEERRTDGEFVACE